MTAVRDDAACRVGAGRGRRTTGRRGSNVHARNRDIGVEGHDKGDEAERLAKHGSVPFRLNTGLSYASGEGAVALTCYMGRAPLVFFAADEHPLQIVRQMRWQADKSARAQVALYDELARVGHIGWIELELRPGAGRVVGPARLDAAARLAAEVAIRAALGRRWDRWDATWSVQLTANLPVQKIKGDSLGLAVAVAARAALQSRVVPADCVFTGAVNARGELGEVGGVPEKAAAAAAQGAATLVVPPGAPSFSAPGRLEITEIERLFERLWPARRWALAARTTALALLGPALVASELLARPDASLRQALASVATAPLEARNTAIVLTPAQERAPDGTLLSFRQRRSELPRLVQDLVAAGVRSITLDRALTPEDPSDEALAAALRAAVAQGVPVVLAIRWREGPMLPAAAALRSLLEDGTVHSGLTEFERPAGADLALALLVSGRATGDDGRTWHAAAETVALWSRQYRPPRWSDRQLQIGALAVPAPAGRVWLRPTQPSPCWMVVAAGYEPTPQTRCTAVATLADQQGLAGRAAVVGVPSDEDTVTLGGRVAYGVELNAAAIENLAVGGALRPWGVGARTAASALATLAAGAIVAVSAARRRGHAIAVVGLLTLAGLAGLATLGVLLDVLPTLLGVIAAAAAGDHLRRWHETGR